MDNYQGNAPRVRAREPSVFSALASEDATEWLERYIQIANLNRWTPEQRLDHVGMFFEGVARNWFPNRNGMLRSMALGKNFYGHSSILIIA